MKLLGRKRKQGGVAIRKGAAKATPSPISPANSGPSGAANAHTCRTERQF